MGVPDEPEVVMAVTVLEPDVVVVDADEVELMEDDAELSGRSAEN